MQLKEPQDLLKNDPFLDDVGLPRYFDMQAEIGYTKHIGGAPATRELLEMCGASAETFVLNVGCGAGATTAFMVETFGCHVVGIDMKPNMIESSQTWALRKGVADRTEFQVADAQDLPFEDETFDIVVSESVNVFVADRARAARGYWRVLKPGGMVGLSESIQFSQPSPAIAKLIDDVIGHPLLPATVWENMLNDAGFVEIESRPRQVNMRQESRNQLGFLGAGDVVRMIGNWLKMLSHDSLTRDLVKQIGMATPAEFVEYIGYGLFVGRKPEVEKR